MTPLNAEFRARGETVGLSALEIARDLDDEGERWWCALSLLGENQLRERLHRALESDHDAFIGFRIENPAGRSIGVGGGRVVDVAEDPRRPGVAWVQALTTGPEPGPARRRVRSATTLLELARTVAGVIELPPDIGHYLDRVDLKEAGLAGQIQDGIDDLTFIDRLIAQYRVLQPNAAVRSLIRTGGLDPKTGTAGRRILAWDERTAYEAMGEPNGRRELQFDPEDGHEWPSFGPPIGPGPDGRGVPGATWRERTRRPLTADRWAAWSTRDGTLWTEAGRRVVRRVDRFYPTGDDGVGWDTRFAVIAFTTPWPVAPASTWVGMGIAGAWADGWLRVRLPGFEPGADHVLARLLTASGGTDGRSGLNLVPEPGRPVAVVWSGWFNQPPFALGEIRVEPPQLAAPSIWLDRPFEVRLNELSARLEGKLRIEAGGSIEFEGQGGRVVIDGDGLNTGQQG